jgi:hypothetical protein
MLYLDALPSPEAISKLNRPIQGRRTLRIVLQVHDEETHVIDK